MRTGDAGEVLASRDVVITVPNVVAGAAGDVANATTDAAFASGAGAPAFTLAIEILGAPIAGMGAFFAWVSNVATGQVSVRFMAATGAIATADRTFRIRRTR